MARKLPPSHKLVQLNARISPDVNKKLNSIKLTDGITKRQALERAVVGYYRYRLTGGEDYFKKVMQELITNQSIIRKNQNLILKHQVESQERDSRMLNDPSYYNRD